MSSEDTLIALLRHVVCVLGKPALTLWVKELKSSVPMNHTSKARSDDVNMWRVKSLCFFLLQWAEFVLFASLLVAVCVIFSIMAYFYTYMDPAEIEAQFRDKDGTECRKKIPLPITMKMMKPNKQLSIHLSICISVCACVRARGD